MQFKVANVKVSIKVSAIPLDIVCKIAKERNISLKVHNNFIVLKANFTFIIFKAKNLVENHINITKIPNVKSIPIAILEIENILMCEHFNLCVDNIIASSSVNKAVSLINIVKSRNFEKIKYNNQKFPGLFITFKKGTAIIFHSGKIVIVGCKRICDIECILRNISVNI